MAAPNKITPGLTRDTEGSVPGSAPGPGQAPLLPQGHGDGVAGFGGQFGRGRGQPMPPPMYGAPQPPGTAPPGYGYPPPPLAMGAGVRPASAAPKATPGPGAPPKPPVPLGRSSFESSVTELESMLSEGTRPGKLGADAVKHKSRAEPEPKSKTWGERWMRLSPIARITVIVLSILAIALIILIIYEVTVVLVGKFGQD